MKQVKIILGVALIAMIGLFTACEEDEDSEAQITISKTNVPDSIDVNTAVTLEFSVITDEKIETIELRKGTNTLDLKEDNFTDSNADNYSYTDTLAKEEDEGSTLDMALRVVDKEGNFETYDFSIEVRPIEEVGDPISTYSDKILGSYEASDGSTFASADGSVYQLSEAASNSDKIDFLYYHGNTNNAVIAAPDDSEAQTIYSGTNGPGNWSTVNETRFSATTMTASDFDAIDDDVEILDAASNVTESKMTDLSQGDVFAFETASSSTHPNKKGLIKVTAVNGTGGTSTIDITVKVQQ